MTSPSGSQFIVQGASRGIGFSITEQILARDPDSVVLATCRGIPSQAKALANLQEKYQNRLKLRSEIHFAIIRAKAAKNTCFFGEKYYDVMILCAQAAPPWYPPHE